MPSNMVLGHRIWRRCMSPTTSIFTCSPTSATSPTTRRTGQRTCASWRPFHWLTQPLKGCCCQKHLSPKESLSGARKRPRRSRRRRLPRPSKGHHRYQRKHHRPGDRQALPRKSTVKKGNLLHLCVVYRIDILADRGRPLVFVYSPSNWTLEKYWNAAFRLPYLGS